MISFRKVFASLLTGSLLLVAVGARAGAVESDVASLAIAERGLALGLASAEAVALAAEHGSLEGEGIAHALSVLEGVMARFEARENRGNGRGPARAIAVHQALLAGNLPSSVDQDDSVPGLAKAYGQMRSQLKGEGRNPNAGSAGGPKGPAAP